MKNAGSVKEGPYQQRYLEHQKIEERHSERKFGQGELTDDELAVFLKTWANSPSSCNRKAVEVVDVYEREKKELLSGILVGGVGWIQYAPVIFLLFADKEAYRAEGEINYMPYLDAGVLAGQFYYVMTALGLAGCFVNPNIREMNKEHFKKIFGDKIFCGAFVVGRKDGNKNS